MANLGLTELLIVGAACAVLAGLLALSLWMIAAVVRGTRNRTDMGINISLRNTCPTCAQALPVLRTPTSVRQAIWGGWTCRRCGTEVDKWGRPIAR